MVPIFWHHLLGGDVEEIGNFQEGKIRSHGSIFLASPLGGDVEKIGDLKRGKYVHLVAFFWQEGKLVLHD